MLHKQDVVCFIGKLMQSLLGTLKRSTKNELLHDGVHEIVGLLRGRLDGEFERESGIRIRGIGMDIPIRVQEMIYSLNEIMRLSL